MPVLSEETKQSFSPFTYLFLLSAVLVLSYSSWTLLKRWRAAHQQQLPFATAKNEKEGLLFQDSPTPTSLSPQKENLNVNPNFQRPPQPLPFTPPTPASNQEYYSSSPMQDFTPTAALITTTPPQYPSEFEFVTSPISTSPITQSPLETFDPSLPRRRSYTKQTPSGAEVSGEIIIGEGWRRHTRVFGGGVCKACEESDRRMTA